MLDGVRRSIRLKITFLVLVTVLAALLCAGTLLVLDDLRQQGEGGVSGLASLGLSLATVVPVLLISLLVALALFSLLQNAVTRPIFALAGTAPRGKAAPDVSVALEESSRALQREVAVRQEAERALSDANRRQDEFLATLAHELRNPLAPIRNAVHYIQAKGAADPEAQKLIPIIDRQVKHMARLIDDLMDISRLTSDKLELRISEFRLDEFLQGAVNACRPALAEAGHTILVHPAPPDVHLKADRARLDQIAGNLLGNAIKYTPSGGHIEMSARVEEKNLVLVIKDDGIGIPRGQQERIFEPFSQLDRSLEKAKGGLGIGLALTRRLAQLHNGSVTVESGGRGKGTTFRVSLPIVVDAGGEELVEAGAGSGAVTTSKAAEATPEKPVRTRVLVADDNQDAAETLAALLRAAGHETATAYDGKQALDLLDHGRFDVAVLDIGMPRLNGYDVAEQVRRGPKGAHMRLVALTGWGQTEDRRRALAAGFDDHLTKPVHPESLLALIASSGAAEARDRTG